MYPDYSRSERVADGSMHAIGLIGAISGSMLLLIWSSRVASPWEMTAIAIYAITLIATFAASAFYHMTPWKSLRPALRRIDHAAIYLKIAGTYTPLVVMIGSGLAYVILGIVWALALIGITLKLLFWSTPGRMGPALYLVMGWMSIILLWTSWSEVPFGFIAAGGLLYTVGVVFYAAKTMKFSNAIWHGFVIAASACFFAAITIGATQHGLV
ncbi:hemolysin III family protein [Hoeflea sp.]|uniref:PAQR family membrane homeostasis protein TrhA n=1 Tax=Hoeflea sp. TaxID=1940281 RepID=UPI0019B72FF8|nr:hemolysin III family protein [Hoeflea sp.]MBC7280391.1 hemolysin III family protein [Hoeflea sp.]